MNNSEQECVYPGGKRMGDTQPGLVNFAAIF